VKTILKIGCVQHSKQMCSVTNHVAHKNVVCLKKLFTEWLYELDWSVYSWELLNARLYKIIKYKKEEDFVHGSNNCKHYDKIHMSLQ
jgi:hypothetical protein